MGLTPHPLLNNVLKKTARLVNWGKLKWICHWIGRLTDVWRPDLDFERFSKNSPSIKVLLCWCCGITFDCNTAVLMKFISRAYICMSFVIIPNKTYIHYEIFTLFFALEYNKLRYAVKQKKRYYLGIFPNMGGGSSQIPKLL